MSGRCHLPLESSPENLMMDHGVLQCVRSDLKRTADGIVRPESMSRSNMNAT